MTIITSAGLPASDNTFDRTVEQRFDALEKANNVRSIRSQLKKEVKAGRRDVRSLLADPPETIWTMKVYDLLVAVPKFGRTKALKVLRYAEVSPAKTVGGVTLRQRRELIRLLGGRR